MFKMAKNKDQDRAKVNMPEVQPGNHADYSGNQSDRTNNTQQNRNGNPNMENKNKNKDMK